MEPAIIGRTVTETNVWLKDMSDGTSIHDENKAYVALRAVLQHLRDRLTVEQAAHLGDQLPTLVRGIYYDRWKPSAQPTKDRSFPEFVEACRDKLSEHPEIDAEEAVAKTIQVLKQHVDHGELRHVFSQLPKDMREIFSV